MAYIEIIDKERGLFDAEAVRRRGEELRAQFENAEPFPHIVIDDFISEEMLDLCLEQFPAKADPMSKSFDREQERYKTSYHPDYLSPPIRSFFHSLNSLPFIQFVQNVTGIRGLIPDPYYSGGGFHETRQGGHLDVHIDFNLHRPMNLERRVNLLIYLNRDWSNDYGGGLELWDEKMSRCVQAVEPAYGRCVIFATRGKTYHGHPRPVAHPRGESRRSIALYYYTATWNDLSKPATTQFRARPGTDDAVDWRVRGMTVAREYLPPFLSRPIIRKLRVKPQEQA